MIALILSMAMPWTFPFRKRWWKAKLRAWPSRSERKNLVRSAEQQAADSRSKADEARKLAQDLRRARGDAVAESIIKGLQDRRAPG